MDRRSRRNQSVARELLNDDGLAALTALLRRYHEAVADFLPSTERRWTTGQAALKSGEIICHGDPGPWNSIWRDGTPVAFVDYDSAHPAPAVYDVAYLAWKAVPFRPDGLARDAGFETPPDRLRRLQVIVETYGVHLTPTYSTSSTKSCASIPTAFAHSEPTA